MAQAPSNRNFISGIKTEQASQNELSRVNSDESFGEVARNLATIFQPIFNDIEEQDGRRRAIETLSRGEMPELDPVTYGVSEGAYQDYLHGQYLSRTRSDVTSHLETLKTLHAGDTEGFIMAANAFRDTVLPTIDPTIRDEINIFFNTQSRDAENEISEASSVLTFQQLNEQDVDILNRALERADRAYRQGDKSSKDLADSEIQNARESLHRMLARGVIKIDKWHILNQQIETQRTLSEAKGLIDEAINECGFRCTNANLIFGRVNDIAEELLPGLDNNGVPVDPRQFRQTLNKYAEEQFKRTSFERQAKQIAADRNVKERSGRVRDLTDQFSTIGQHPNASVIDQEIKSIIESGDLDGDEKYLLRKTLEDAQSIADWPVGEFESRKAALRRASLAETDDSGNPIVQPFRTERFNALCKAGAMIGAAKLSDPVGYELTRDRARDNQSIGVAPLNETQTLALDIRDSTRDEVQRARSAPEDPSRRNPNNPLSSTRGQTTPTTRVTSDVNTRAGTEPIDFSTVIQQFTSPNPPKTQREVNEFNGRLSARLDWCRTKVAEGKLGINDCFSNSEIETLLLPYYGTAINNPEGSLHVLDNFRRLGVGSAVIKQMAASQFSRTPRPMGETSRPPLDPTVDIARTTAVGGTVRLPQSAFIDAASASLLALESGDFERALRITTSLQFQGGGRDVPGGDAAAGLSQISRQTFIDDLPGDARALLNIGVDENSRNVAYNTLFNIYNQCITNAVAGGSNIDTLEASGASSNRGQAGRDRVVPNGDCTREAISTYFGDYGKLSVPTEYTDPPPPDAILNSSGTSMRINNNSMLNISIGGVASSVGLADAEQAVYDYFFGQEIQPSRPPGRLILATQEMMNNQAGPMIQSLEASRLEAIRRGEGVLPAFEDPSNMMGLVYNNASNSVESHRQEATRRANARGTEAARSNTQTRSSIVPGSGLSRAQISENLFNIDLGYIPSFDFLVPRPDGSGEDVVHFSSSDWYNEYIAGDRLIYGLPIEGKAIYPVYYENGSPVTYDRNFSGNNFVQSIPSTGQLLLNLTGERQEAPQLMNHRNIFGETMEDVNNRVDDMMDRVKLAPMMAVAMANLSESGYPEGTTTPVLRVQNSNRSGGVAMNMEINGRIPATSYPRSYSAGVLPRGQDPVIPSDPYGLPLNATRRDTPSQRYIPRNLRFTRYGDSADHAAIPNHPTEVYSSRRSESSLVNRRS